MGPKGAAASRRRQRKDNVRAVVDFISGADSERASLYRASLGAEAYEALESPRPRASSISSETTRPVQGARERERERRSCYAKLARNSLAFGGVLAFLGVFAVQGPGALLGNGSQLLITGAFAIQDPLLLNVVSVVGAAALTRATRGCFN